MSKKSILILGAKSDIGISVAHRFASEGFDVYLAARNSINLKDDCSDIKIRYDVNSSFHEFDVLKLDTHEHFILSLPEIPNVVLSAVGYLGEQNKDQFDFRQAIKVIRTNYEGVVNIFGLFANHFEKRGYGTLIGISSVAGDRGRSLNYIYGSAKAGLSAYLSGLRNRLYSKGINVITVKPGFVNTKMTSKLKMNPLLTTNSSRVSKYIYEAYKYKKTVVYITKIWFIIMIFIKLIPEKIFRMLKF